MQKYIDLHTHTLLSDGNYSPTDLIQLARHANVGHLAITDHNRILENIESLQKSFDDIEIISGSEISAHYYTANGEKKEIHIVGLFLNQTNELKDFLKHNKSDGSGRITAMLTKLADCGVDMNCDSYEEFKKAYFPGRRSIGRPQLAEIIVKKGFAKTVDEAMDIYIGDYGLKLAYVLSDFRYSDMVSVINAIHSASGVAVLAHPLSYKLTYEEVRQLVDFFKNIGGDAMEVLYGRYTDDDVRRLKMLAAEHSLLPSCGSDFHGNRHTDRLDHCFPVEYLEALRDRSTRYR